MSLYLKYRPQDFKTIVGQKHIVTTLVNALEHDALTHAYLFSGPRGTGKTSLARIVAKSLNCSNLQEGANPCGQCENCEAILKGRMVDLIEIDAASNRGIDEIRELRDKILFAPTQGRAKIYIIDEVHMLTKEAFNALLKTLEEPPAHAYFILATTEVHKIPETIISRCQQFNFKRIVNENIIHRLESIAIAEKVQAEPDALELIAKMSGGSLRDAIGLFEQMTIKGAIIYQEVLNAMGITGHMMIESFFKALIEKEPLKALEMISQVNGMGQNLNQFCKELIAYFREQMLLGIHEKKNVESIIDFIDIFSVAKQQINQATIPQLPLEVAVIKACGCEEVKRKEETAIQKTESATESAEVKKVDKESEEKGLHQEPEIIPLVTLEMIKENWQRIIENIETPFIRMSFVDSEPVQLEKGNLHLAFRSSTLMEKVINPGNQKEILKAFENVLKVKINLKPELKKITLKPVVKKAEESESPSIIEMAKEVFGA